MTKSVVVPILNNEYKVLVCWSDMKHLRKTMLEYNYSPDHITKTYLDNEKQGRRGVTYSEHRCYPTIWIDANMPAADTMGTLAHEAVHAVDFIFEAIAENLHHSEIFAHSVGAIVRTTIDAMGILKAKKGK